MRKVVKIERSQRRRRRNRRTKSSCLCLAHNSNTHASQSLKLSKTQKPIINNCVLFSLIQFFFLSLPDLLRSLDNVVVVVYVKYQNAKQTKQKEKASKMASSVFHSVLLTNVAANDFFFFTDLKWQLADVLLFFFSSIGSMKNVKCVLLLGICK